MTCVMHGETAERPLDEFTRPTQHIRKWYSSEKGMIFNAFIIDVGKFIGITCACSLWEHLP